MTEWLHFHFSLLCTGEGNGNPLQCSCLENSRDRGAWWAAQSRTRLKRLSSSSSMAQLKTCLQCRRGGFNPWMGRSPGEGNDNPFQYSFLGNHMDRRAWRATVYGVSKESLTTKWLNNNNMWVIIQLQYIYSYLFVVVLTRRCHNTVFLSQLKFNAEPPVPKLVSNLILILFLVGLFWEWQHLSP